MAVRFWRIDPGAGRGDLVIFNEAQNGTLVENGRQQIDSSAATPMSTTSALQLGQSNAAGIFATANAIDVQEYSWPSKPVPALSPRPCSHTIAERYSVCRCRLLLSSPPHNLPRSRRPPRPLAQPSILPYSFPNFLTNPHLFHPFPSPLPHTVNSGSAVCNSSAEKQQEVTSNLKHGCHECRTC